MKSYTINTNEEKQIVINQSGDYEVTLAGDGARVEILGGFLLENNESLDVSLTIIHKGRNTWANTLIKAVVGGEAKANISGTIKVDEKAQQTESFLTENVLLISKRAQATAVPDLEILANEVKCSHAATVGKVDEEQVYYLMSRGMNRKKSENMIVEGFLAPVWDRIIENK